jgi:CHAT domain-containing protein
MQPFGELPATAREVEDIRGLVPDPHILTGPAASKGGLQSALAGGPWVVHLATHAYFAGVGGCAVQSEASPVPGERAEPIAPNPLLLSGIALAGANRPGRVGLEAQSGILTAYEVAGLDLRSADLVVLSPCDTGTGLHLRGQEVQGLRWGFRAAGAGALVTSLWRSNDVATRRLMRAFYQALLTGDIPDDVFRGAEALRRAQLEQVRAERMIGLRRPATWANFVFSGVL